MLRKWEHNTIKALSKKKKIKLPKKEKNLKQFQYVK